MTFANSTPSEIISFDTRNLTQSAYEALKNIRSPYDLALADGTITFEDYKKHLQEQRSQANDLYTYIATWGLMRLKGEEIALDKWNPDRSPSVRDRAIKSQEGKREVIASFFECLERISHVRPLANKDGLETLLNRNTNTEKYLGLTSLALAITKEFSFWVDAVYHDIKPGDSNDARSQ